MDYTIVAASIDDAQAAEMRARLASFAEDWEIPETSVYDNYDEAKSKKGISPCKAGVLSFYKTIGESNETSKNSTTFTDLQPRRGFLHSSC